MNNFYFLFILFVSSFGMFSQEGTLDTSFHSNGIVTTDFFGAWDKGLAIVQQEDGKIVASGHVINGNDSFFGFCRYLDDGELDTTFGVNGKVVLDFEADYFGDYFSTLYQQDDGKLVATGNIYYSAGSQDFFITRLLPNGTLDTNFGDNGLVTTDFGADQLAGTVFLPDGKILIGGISAIGNSRYVLIAKYLSSGALDNSFGTNGIVNTYVNEQSAPIFGTSVLRQPDGKILLSFRKEENNENIFVIHRYLENGDLDSSFGDNGVLNTIFTGNSVYGSLALKSNGNIVFGGKTNNTSNPFISQLLPDGSLDTSFGTSGSMDVVVHQDYHITKIILDAHENILVSGNQATFETFDYWIVKYNTDGQLDTNFGNNGKTNAFFEGTDLSIQNDGKILVTGFTLFHSGPVDFLVMRIHGETLGIDESNKNHLMLYPNPSNGIFTLKSMSGFSSEMPYMVTDVSGKIIQKSTITDIHTDINLSEASNGLYFLKVSEATFKLLKN